MEKIKCIAVDDEPLALDLLAENIERIPFLELVARCNDAFEAMEVLNREPVDLMFLDIQMPALTGIDFLKTINHKPMVIFLTAYKQHALESYDYNVLDYLLKPVSFERFLKSVQKAHELFMLKKTAQKEDAEPERLVSSPDYFLVPADYSLVKIVFNDITFIEGLKDYVKIYLSQARKPIVTRLSMKELEDTLPTTSFLRVHKSFIVNMDKVKAIRKRLLVVDDTEIPVTDMYRTAVGQYFGIDF